MPKFRELPGPVRGVLWMLVQAALYSTMIASVRALAADFSVFEITAFRMAVGLVALLPWYLSAAPAERTTTAISALWLRTLCGVGGILAWFAAIAALPLSDAAALQFTLPLFCVVGAALVLGERVGPVRWIAVLVGFGGALVILRPGFSESRTAMLLVLLSAVFYSIVHLTTKRIGSRASGSLMVFHLSLVALPVALIPAAFDWRWPGWEHAGWIAALGLSGTYAHVFMARAYRAADASIVAPIDFSKLIFAALFGWVLFGEYSDGWTWVGALVIFAATTISTRIETRAAAPEPARARAP